MSILTSLRNLQLGSPTAVDDLVVVPLLGPDADGRGYLTRTGLRVKAALDTRRYETALQVPDEVFARLRITPHTFHGDWNYTIAPRH